MGSGGRVAVIGAGTMGHGIAQVAAMAGAETVLVDRTEALVEAGLERVRANLAAGIERGKVEPADRDATLERLTGSTRIEEAAEGVALAVEAVPERLELKRDVFAALERATPARAILATNTSSLSITRIQDGRERPGRIVGLHFFNPVHIMKLVEVVRGEETAEAVIEESVGWIRSLGKEPIVVNDSPGFASSRLGVALGLEAMRMLEEGVASAADIDTAMTLGYRHPMGPLRLTDLVGLDIRLHVAEYLHETLGGERFRPPRILREKVEKGELGQKTGRGFFDWSE
ncbi:MAG: 3-hydroxybutyryl-CoA dehydrogenase [Gemmatimonadetes bacterium]|nr:3-hydroxyacyl-CoA dehydrogenase family protein [Gemmatimonadota bacterium]NIQ54813.1 3-hydroxyacyl-CoA dehydrogenase family protein [Gemmatimonadota bacterium]NIU75012.1 3-hydroxybutyryl-CoA dehydrogenase [Gammaproteobacteria bacterium]NIX44876.1 3-hydroxybutyryl-CoA dehydrogenase [Gemmatimonadota bacterium]NIY09115.1 3-hydroxybutyryl-CoA dehydrogenase [Gemmatimonadota bacterium]